jgi:hypothetical protein
MLTCHRECLWRKRNRTARRPLPLSRFASAAENVSYGFHIGLIVGTLDDRREGDRILLSFEVTDEIHPASGAGTITLHGGRLIVKLLFHYDDRFAFSCVRVD